MIGLSKLRLSVLAQYMNIAEAISDDPDLFNNLDDEVWSFARKHEHIPDFDRIYYVVVCEHLENLIKEKYPTINVNYYIDESTVHFFLDYLEIKNVTDYRLVISDYLQKVKVQWQPELFLQLSENSGIGVKIHNKKVQYAYAQDNIFGNIQESTLETETFDAEDGSGIVHKKFFCTANVGQKIYLDDFKPIEKAMERNPSTDEQQALFNTLGAM